MSVSQRARPTPRQLVVGLLALIAAACHRQAPSPAPAPPPEVTRVPATPVAITSGSRLIAAMHDRYAGAWYRTLTFVQTTTLTRGAGEPIVQTWYEAADLPGRLRIDTNRDAKSGAMYSRDSVYSFADGKLVRADTGYNELLILGFDVYTQSAARTEAVLRHLGVDLSAIHEGTWRGEPVYVVGAERGDTASKQFWVDRDRLLFVRLLEKTPRGHTDFRFNKYERAGGGWIAAEVEQLVNGKRVLLEQYRDIRTNVPLSTAFFDPKEWG
ncbi:MAG: hypothetical protein ACREPM_19615, partial [Gemmatimonadaceae bacterium]